VDKSRQPDEFISLSNRVADFVRRNVVGVGLMILAAVVVIGLVWGFRAYQTSRAEKATAKLTWAVDIYTQELIPKSVESPKIEEGDPPRFRTHAERLDASLKALDEVVTKHGGTGVGDLALLIRAGVYFDARKYDQAIADYSKALETIKDATTKSRALEGLAYCYEAKSNWEKAISYFEQSATAGEERFSAIYHQGRILALRGDKQGAAKKFKEVIDASSNQTLIGLAGARLASLGLK
jgi:predicted negative regulator of RcsB-dependent stress response